MRLWGKPNTRVITEPIRSATPSRWHQIYTHIWYGHGNRLVNGINCDLLAFLRKHFANETDTSSVKTRSGSSCHRFGLRSVASGQWQWQFGAAFTTLRPTYGSHKNVKHKTFATLAPFARKQKKWSTHVANAPGRNWMQFSIWRSWTPPFGVAAAVRLCGS